MTSFPITGVFETCARSRAGRICIVLVLVALLGSVSIWGAPAAALGASKGVTEIRLSHVHSSDGANTTSSVAVDPVTDTVYVLGDASIAHNDTDDEVGALWVINGRTNKVKTTINVPGAAESGVAVNPVTDTVYVADPQLLIPPATGTTPGVLVINGRTNKITATLAQGGGEVLTVDSKTDTIYVSGPGYDVSVINGKTNATVADVPNVFYPVAAAIDTTSNTLYVAGGASGGTDGVWVIDGSNNTAEGLSAASPVTLPFDYPPSGIAADPKTGTIYVSAQGSINGNANAVGVGVIHRGRNRITHFIGLRNAYAGSIGVDTATNAIYVATSSEDGCGDTVAEIAGKTNKVVAIVNGIDLANAVAVDSSTDTVYVTNGDDLAVFHGGFSNKAKSCGGGGVTIGG